jgi:hypothetical protein
VPRLPFAFAPAWRWPALLLGITPATAWVEVDDDSLVARFGAWRLRTPLGNVRDTSVTGGYAWHRTAGPPHLSLTDRGVTLATNGERGVCVRFHEPVRCLDPTGRLRHPGATFTVADPDALVRALEAS